MSPARFQHHWCNGYKSDIIKEQEALIINRVKLCNSLFPPSNCYDIATDFSDLRKSYEIYISQGCSINNW